MSVKERDPLTGHETTGHEWDGITELNTRVPRAVWFFVAVTHIWALVYWVLMPAWPGITTYTKGLLGYQDAARIERQVTQAAVERADWTDALTTLSADELMQDATLMAHVARTAPTVFGDNCAGCHGTDLGGGPGFPSLVDDAWLWGGDSDTVMETLRVGINAPHPETRFAQMLAFGETGILTRPQIRTVVDYVQSLSGLDTRQSPARLAEGATLFAENCTSCHGDDAQGIQDMGAPNLADNAWIYGGDDASMFTTINMGRQGWMPAWEDRLTEADRMLLTLYIQSRAAEAAE
tara:strand:- start:26257 stop:27135 length:879 start_codon:yes stop_codon:yes gene_type:complete